MFDGFELGCAARTIYGEARGEGDDGMKAVAHVILNRVTDGRWGPSLGSVCLAPYQFSCWNLNDPTRHAMLSMFSGDIVLAAAEAAFGDANAEQQGGTDPTNGATHYRRIGTPAAWADGHTPCATIGHHEFFKAIA